MRIPLDYYRILGLPIQATAEQLKQAHRDRTLQLPRREYSEISIEARKALVDEAYTLLSDPQERQKYDAQFLSRSYSSESAVEVENAAHISSAMGEETLRSLAANLPTPDPQESPTPTIEINESEFVGALLILQELGEYELVIRLGRPFLTSGDGNLASGRYGDPTTILQDIVLTLALACLELGREQWQQNQYEGAAESLETGQELLLRENLFPTIRAELRSDLYKLRPYRVLELVARPLEQNQERWQGVKLLKAMLHERGGIEGTADDLSGLSTDDFLRFIQQLRGYLTAGEQQEIFEAEARRPSAVGTYLAVYALLARGFAFHQPALVQRARQLLRRLGTQQDVHLEQAVCALLLGQAEEAGNALSHSQEYEPLAFIREHSQQAPDLLPGLCLYAERWLREEVFTHFRDLATQQTALKDYFADPQVQAYLEAMPLSAPPAPPVAAPDPNTSVAGHSLPASIAPPTNRPAEPAMPYGMQSPAPAAQSPIASRLPGGEVVFDGNHELSIAERVSQLSPEGQLQGRDMSLSPSEAVQNGYRPAPAVVSSSPPPRQARSRSPRWGRLGVVVLLGVLTMGTVGFVTVRALGWVSYQLTRPKLRRPVLNMGLTEPPISIPSPPPPEAQIGVKDVAERAINDWLAAKRQALSQAHDVTVLDTVLIDPALKDWRNRANGALRDNWYYQYEHILDILEVEPDDPGADLLTVRAQVQEVADFYQFGVLSPEGSYDDTLTMQYVLARQDGDWFVKEMTKLE